MTVRQLFAFGAALLALAACAETKTSPPQVSQLQQTAEELEQDKRSLDSLTSDRNPYFNPAIGKLLQETTAAIEECIADLSRFATSGERSGVSPPMSR